MVNFKFDFMPSLLAKSHSEASHTISKKTARSCHTKQVQNSYDTTVHVQDNPSGWTELHKILLVDYVLGMGEI